MTTHISPEHVWPLITNIVILITGESINRYTDCSSELKMILSCVESGGRGKEMKRDCQCHGCEIEEKSEKRNTVVRMAKAKKIAKVNTVQDPGKESYICEA